MVQAQRQTDPHDFPQDLRVVSPRQQAEPQIRIAAAQRLTAALDLPEAAPEVLRGDEATPAADVYALGVAFFYLLTGVWYDKVLVEKDRTDLHLLQYYEYRWRDVLPAMLDEDPAKRPLDLDGLVARLTQPDSAEPRRRPFARPYFLLSPPRPAPNAMDAKSEEEPLLPSEVWLKDAFEVPESMR